MKGFTIIELIIYIGIVGGVLLMAFNFGLDIIYGDVKSQAIREVQQNSRLAMERITRTIKEASAINSPGPGNSASSLSLEMAESELNPTIIDVSEQKIQITQGTGIPYELTNNRVLVSNLLFTNLSYEDTPGTIRIEMTLDHVNPTERSEYQVSFKLTSSASLFPGGAALVEEGYCQGTPALCSSFREQTSCQNQEGCSWNPAICSGDCTPCSELVFWDCIFQAGCNWNWRQRRCLGNCKDCDSFSSQSECQNQLGCSWTEGFCSGTATPCEVYSTESTCTSQEGCQWITL